MLLAHWKTSNREKLEEDLEYQCKLARPGRIGYLRKQAKAHGWKSLYGKARREQKAKPCDHAFGQMLSVSEAEKKLGDAVHDFFETGKSKIIRASCGFGKTDAVLLELAKVPFTKKVLFLAPSHTLAAEHRAKFNIFAAQHRKTARSFGSVSSHIYGRTYQLPSGLHMCENEDALTHKRSGLETCLKCVHQMQCRYIEQFNGLGNVRFLTVNELYNPQGIFWHGTEVTDGRIQPKKSGWVPELVIVDENCLRFALEETGSETGFRSLQKIMAICSTGEDIATSVKKSRREVRSDYKEYVAAKKDGKSSSPGDAIILEFCMNFVDRQVSDAELLRSLFYEYGTLKLRLMKPVASRFRDTPIIILDATADRDIYGVAFPHFDVIDVSVKSRSEISVYQCQNFTAKRDDLKNKDYRDRVIDQIRRISAGYRREGKSVGIITYKTVPDFECDRFDKWACEQIDGQQHGYFIGIQGTNAFVDVDCLIVLGRHRIPDSAFAKYARAIYGPGIGDDRHYKDVPVRMKDGTMSLSNFVFSDDRMQAVYDQFCTAETIQAIGRARLIHGKAKDVYLFSNESLGADVEITGFFDFEYADFTDGIEIPYEICCVEATPAAFQKLGFTEHHIKNHRPLIEAKLIKSGFSLFEVQFKDRHYKRHMKEFFARNEADLSAHISGKIESITLQRSCAQETKPTSNEMAEAAA
jgi:hypothetical protein